MRRPNKFPPYVKAYIDRHGKPRYYFRRKGHPSTPLPGLPWSPTFMGAHEAAMGAEKPSIGKVWRVNLDEKPATIWMVSRSHGEGMIAAARQEFKSYFDCRGAAIRAST